MSGKKYTPQEIKQRYTERANFVRSLGFHITYRGNRKATPHQKAAVTRAYRRVAGYTAENRFILKKLSSANLRKARKLVSPSQVTPSGVMIQIPGGVKRDEIKVKFERGPKNKDKLVVYTPGRREEYLKLDPKQLAIDPSAEIKKVLGQRKPRFVKIIINGYEINRTNDGDTRKAQAIFLQYWNQLYEELTDDEVREEKLEETGNYPLYSQPAIRAKQVSERFLLKLIY